MFDSFTRTTPASPAPVKPSQAVVSIFLGRIGFETGATQLIEAASAAAGECAVLYVGLSGAAIEYPEANHRTLSLAANILRARVKSGALAYLGDSRFAVLLQGVSGRDAVAYCREVLSVLGEIRLHCQGEVLTAQAWVGGTMVEDHHDGMALLEAAEHAAAVAQGKPGRRLHMIHEQQDAAISVYEETAVPTNIRARISATLSGRAA